MGTQIFFSYNTQDRSEVQALYEGLKDRGYNPWMDKPDIDHGERWRPQLEQKLAESEVFFLFIGRSWPGEWQDEEWDIALSSNKKGNNPHKIVPIILPSFDGVPTLGGFLLNRQLLDLREYPFRELDKLVSVITDEDNDARPDVPDSDSTTSIPLTRYLKKLWRDCFDLNTTSFQYAVQQEAGKLSLPSVYTALDVIERPSTTRHDLIGEEQQSVETDFRKPVVAALLEHPLLVLTGDPGSGKSTVVDFLSVCLVGEQLSDRNVNLKLVGIDGFPELLPIRVVLREYAPLGLAKDMALWDYIKSADDFAGCSGEVEAGLNRENGALVMLDGIDEVPDSRGWRLQLQQRVYDFQDRFPRARILLTSRPYAYQSPEEKLTGFSDRRIAAFTMEQMQAFVDNWYQEVGLKEPRLGTERAKQYAGQLKQSLEDNERLQALGQNPLLMSLMGWLHRTGEGGRLPEKRQKLYELCVEHLIDVWQKNKPVYDDTGKQIEVEYDVKRELGINHEILRQALEKLAFRAHAEQPKQVGTCDIPVAWLTEVLVEATHDSEVRPDTTKITDFVTHRAGILIEAAQQRIFRFPHRTFQEYLAACYLTRFQFPYCLRDKLKEDDERWREALLLAAAYVEKGNSVWELVNVFCIENWTGKPDDGDFYLALRAALAVIETDKHKQVDQYQRERFNAIKDRLIQILADKNALPNKPQDRAAAGRALAELGDPRHGVTGHLDEGDSVMPDIAWAPIPGTTEMGLADGFKMGHGAGSDELAEDDERWPEGEASVSIESFYLAAYPVTVAQFAWFVEAEDGYVNDAHWTKAGLEDRGDQKAPYLWRDSHWHIGNHPVVGVTWYEAAAFCRWLTARWETVLGERRWMIRLPTEAEWEWAARGPAANRWPWGNDWSVSACNSEESGVGRTTVVGNHPQNRNWVADQPAKCSLKALPSQLSSGLCDAVYDLSGNVWEWCATKWREDYRADAVHGDDQWSTSYREGKDRRVLRGGAYWNEMGRVRGAARLRHFPRDWDNNWGFRCCCASTSSRASES